MRILHILNHIREVGNGIVNVAIDLACLQARAGHQITVISKGGEYESLLAQQGVQHHLLDQTRTWRNLPSTASQYCEIIRQVQPDIVHAHMMTGVVLAKALRFNAHYRLVSTVHNEFQRSAWLMGLADCTIAVSEAVAHAMQQRGIPEAKLKVIRNGTIGSPRQSVCPSLGQSPCEPAVALQHPAIVTVAGLNYRKGISYLIEGFNQIAESMVEAHLYIVGEGPNRNKFEQQANESPFRDRIHFEGFQPDPQRYLRSADVFVLASLQEPFGLVLAEAREAGCAIVASQVGGIPEALEGGEAGQLIPAADSGAIATAIKPLLADPAVRHLWQQKSQRNLELLSAHRMVKETLALYENELRLRKEGIGRPLKQLRSPPNSQST